jgi:hypothetical protein
MYYFLKLRFIPQENPSANHSISKNPASSSSINSRINISFFKIMEIVSSFDRLPTLNFMILGGKP